MEKKNINRRDFLKWQVLQSLPRYWLLAERKVRER